MKKIFRKIKWKKGFTLVESIVSIAILSISTLGFAMFLSASNAKVVEAVQLDRQRAELQQMIALYLVYGDTAELGEDIAIDIITDQNISIGDDEVNILKGHYVIVRNTKTNVQYRIFVADRVQNKDND